MLVVVVLFRSSSNINVRWCEVFGHVQIFWLYSFGHLELVMFPFLVCMTNLTLPRGLNFNPNDPSPLLLEFQISPSSLKTYFVGVYF